jgi:alkanesulfonate monooxygenase SsuD/methylene tetrahydromethanopterin reductase-like flavin-dependent oxidoreductase (luciferase family)
MPSTSSIRINHTPGQYRAQEISRVDFEERAGAHGALFVGSPQQIIDKILHEHELFGHQRFLAQIDIGGLPFARVARVIELFSTEIAPVIRGEVSRGGFKAKRLM